jgi:hypothetical protein
MNNLEKIIYDEYLNIGIRKCKVCQECCDAEFRNSNKSFFTTGIWVVGNNYHKNKVLFVGKVARGDGGGNLVDNQGNIYDCTSSSREYLWNNIKRNRAYWSYTREICKRVFDGSDSIENIAFTNIIKCNSSDTTDKTTYETKEYCIKKMQILRRELLVLQPRIIVFYTGKDYDDYIFKDKCIFDTIANNKLFFDKKVTIGRKEVLWLEAEAELEHNLISILRTGHPERLNKQEFTTRVSGWIDKKVKEYKYHL